MKPFNKKFSGGKPFGKPGFKKYDKKSDKGPVALHAATCSKCGDSCQVPFKPNGKKPIFCSNCFVRDDGEGESRGSFKKPYDGKKSWGKKSFEGSAPTENVSAELKAINAKLDAILKTLSGAEEFEA